MKNIIVFGASNSKESINQQLATYAGTLIKGVQITTLQIKDYQLPLYGIDEEKENGIPAAAKLFDEVLTSADGFVLSLAEHNGAYTAAFKNLFDWVSRINTKVWKDKPLLMLATSPGARGGASVLKIANDRFPYHGAKVVGTFSLPNFNENFKEQVIVHKEYNQQLLQLIAEFSKAI